MIYGAIAGDIIGSRFEFDMPNWRRDFDLFSSDSIITSIARRLDGYLRDQLEWIEK